jgi:xanthine dehydrogenase YagR molybdenum-binding subunit
MAPQSMRGGDGSEIGWGVAVGAYPCLTTPAIAQLKVTDEGDVVISIGGHEMGQGIRTALANAVSRKLGIPAEKVIAIIGDTRAAPRHLTAGSWGTASAIIPYFGDNGLPTIRKIFESLSNSEAH